MLFEDASNPGADPFRINQPRPNQGLPAASSTSTISTLASSDSNGSGNDSNETIATDLNLSFGINSDFLSLRRDSTDILTARQANYVFPRSAHPANLDTVKSVSTDPVLNDEAHSTNHPSRGPGRAKRNVTVGSPTEFRFGGAPPDGGLVPPSHAASRSLDSRGVGNGFSGGQSLGGASVALGARPGGLAPTRPAMLGRQASAMAVLEGASRSALAVPGRNNTGLVSAGAGTVLKDLLKLSPVQPGSLGAGIDMLPPSPGIGSISISPVTKVFNYSPSALQTSTTPNDVGNGSPVNGRGYTHSQSNSYSHTSQTTPHSSVNAQLYPDNPDLPPLDLGMLVTAQDVHTELARTVDGLMAWLGVVDAGLGEVLGIRDMEESEAGEGLGFDLDSESLVGA
ncbi:hypothetical protein RSAG8_10503, partial [Rhizoctonia solani AG-8 WAC10335]